MLFRCCFVIIIICFLLFPVVSAQSDKETYLKAADSFINRGDLDSAAIFYSKANSIGGGDYETLLRQSVLYFAVKDYQKAMDSVNSSLEKQKNRPYPYVLLSRYVQAGFNDSSKRDEYLKTAISLVPVNEADSYSKGLAQYFLGDHEGAKTTLLNSTKNYNKSSAIWNYYAQMEAADGNYNASVKAYDNLINFSSSRMKGSFIGEKIKILAIAGMKSPNEILNMSNQTESLFPGYSVRLEPFIGYAYLQKNDYKNASPYFMNESNGNYGNQTLSDLLRAEFLYKTGDKEDAYKIIRDVHEKALKSVEEPFLYLSTIRLLDKSELSLYQDAMDKKDSNNALWYAQQLVKRNPNNKIYLEALEESKDITTSKSG